ncbi:MAG: acylneuraminate cytidylyltransferase family protein [Nitrospirae bacterium]|nr:acylneuraminate cytidylyltransferase family protein [Nitrospirota bacterium]
MNIAIITARAGSKSILDKNVYPVGGQPLIAYPIHAALDAKQIGAVYISTDGEKIATVSRELGCHIIDRPEELCGDHVNHGDVIKHAVEYVDGRVKDLKNVVLLLGNTVMIDGELIDQALDILETHSDLDSVMTVWQAADDHPLRALEICEGLVRPYGGSERQASTERQSYPKAYYYDQGIWAFRKECVQRHEGPNPWWWMGKRCYPIVRNWMAGRDIHSYLDVCLAEWWLANYPGIKKL